MILRTKKYLRLYYFYSFVWLLTHYKNFGMARYAPKYAYLHRHYGTTTSTGPNIAYLPKNNKTYAVVLLLLCMPSDAPKKRTVGLLPHQTNDTYT